MKKVILAYSGGLDTSVGIKWLSEKGYQVIAFTADLGQGGDWESLKKKAKLAGAARVYVRNLRTEFVTDFIYPALRANAIYESKYLLSTALGRPLIAKYLVEIARAEKAKYVSHGCTGKGNDQVRFEVSIGALDPHLEVIAPARLWEFKSRAEEIRYAQRRHIPIEVTRAKPYSIDRNLWGVSIECGQLEEPWKEPPEDVYQITKDPADAPDRPTYLELYFQDGIPKKIDGKLYDPVGLIMRLNEIGGRFGVGRADLVENRLVGIKSREVYEAPAATILHLAHRELEDLVLDREMAHFKEIISLKYSEVIYYGLWHSPLREALDGFVDKTQRNMTGSIRVKLHKGNCLCVGRRSKYSLYKRQLATYGVDDKFDWKAAEGFIKIWKLPYRRK